MEIKRVGVVGCGLMGSGIAEAAARAGLDVTVVDLDRTTIEAGRGRGIRSILRAEKAGKIAGSQAEAAQARIEFSCDTDSLAHCQIVVEAVAEAEAIKVAVFKALDEVVKAPD